MNNQATLSDLLFDVEMVDTEEFTGIPANSDYSKLIVGTIDGQQTILNACSNRYELVPNSTIFPNIRQVLIDNGMQFTENYQSINNARFYADYVLEDQELAYNVGKSGDIIKPRISVQHSYNGLTKYLIVFGYYRMICSNGLILPVNELKKYNLEISGKHTSSIKNSFIKLNKTIKYFADNRTQINLAIGGTFDQLAGNVVEKWEDRIVEVLNASNIVNVDNSKFSTMDYVKNVIDSEKHLYDNKVNDFLIYNSINQYLNDDTLNKKTPEVRRAKDSKVFETLLEMQS
ncbi:MAG: DUF932 domain-containing protein [Patescibacteria group bacterium]|nr:DUF932 domain-containing protein [Patescibacteria group bacterium]